MATPAYTENSTTFVDANDQRLNIGVERRFTIDGPAIHGAPLR